jgi:1-Cys peroxiredoxin 6
MHIGDQFPNLLGATQDSESFNLYQHVGDKWCVIFTHPGDFTPVCTTELASAASLQMNFKNRNVALVGFSCNSAESHRQWIRDIEYVSGFIVNFPLFCDPTRENAVKLGILDSQNRANDGLPLTVRGTFILKPDKTIASMMVYPHNVGRNLEEVLRVLDSLLLTEQEKTIVTPSNWNDGEDVLVAHNVNDDKANQQFGEDQVKVVKVPSERGKKGLERHYLRYTKAPKLKQPVMKEEDEPYCQIS